MANAEQISSLRRGFPTGRLASMSKRLDEYHRTGQQNKPLLMTYCKSVDETWDRFNVIKEELESLDEDENARLEATLEYYYDLETQLTQLTYSVQPSPLATPISGGSPTTPEPIGVKLPDIHLPTFGSTFKKWSAFYDIISSTISRND